MVNGHCKSWVVIALGLQVTLRAEYVDLGAKGAGFKVLRSCG